MGKLTKTNIKTNSVAINMGSDSDMSRALAAQETLNALGIPTVTSITSAHRTPDLMVQHGQMARERGHGSMISYAGGSAHLPGMSASETQLPVIAVPVGSGKSPVEASYFSSAMMPPGVPTAVTSAEDSMGAAHLAAKFEAANNQQYKEYLAKLRGLDLEGVDLGRYPVLKNNPPVLILDNGYMDNLKAEQQILDMLGVGYETIKVDELHWGEQHQIGKMAELAGVKVIIAGSSGVNIALMTAVKTIPVIASLTATDEKNINAVHESFLYGLQYSGRGERINVTSEDTPANLGHNRNNPALFAGRILGVSDEIIHNKLALYKQGLSDENYAKNDLLQELGGCMIAYQEHMQAKAEAEKLAKEAGAEKLA